MLRTAVLGGVFLISGACALAFETLWFHQARLAFGQSVWASSLVLSAFMAGMALGNWLCARHGDRARDALRWYAGLELLVALAGVALVYLLPELGRVFAPLVAPLADQPAVLNLLRLASALLLLIVPAAAMGMTLPLLARAAGAWDANFGRVLGFLYGANTLGAVLGALATETILLEHFGIRGSALFAGTLNLAAAAAALALSRAMRAPAVPPPATAQPQVGCSHPPPLGARLQPRVGLGPSVVHQGGSARSSQAKIDDCRSCRADSVPRSLSR